MLTDKITLVIGVGHEIGKEVVKALARDGATVIVSYNGSAAKAEETAAEVVAVDSKAETVQYDIFGLGKSGELMDYMIKTYGKLDILVNNAGITRDELSMKMSEADLDVVINTDLKGVSNCMQHVTRQMVKQKGRQIINIVSVVKVMGNAGQMNYAASKVEIIGMTKSTAREMASRRVTVGVIASGFIVIETTDAPSDAVRDAMKQQIPMKAFGETSDIVETAAPLTSEEARYITGQVVGIDGGMAM